MRWSRFVTAQQCVAAVAMIVGMSCLFYGFGLVFLLGQPSPLWAAVGGAAMGAAVVCFVIAFKLIGGFNHE